MSLITTKEMADLLRVKPETLQKQRQKGTSKFTYAKINGKVLYQKPTEEELRVFMVPIQKHPSRSVIKTTPVSRSGRGFHSKSRYKLSQLRNINERRHLDYLKKQNKTHCDNPDCTYCESPLIREQSIIERQPRIRDQEPRRSRYRFYGYTETEPTIEVIPNPPRRELVFKNKIEEMIFRVRNGNK